MDALSLFPPDTRIERDGQLWLGGCRATALTEEYGTPLYVLDRACIQQRCRLYQRLLDSHYPGRAEVAYASKAGLNLALAQLFARLGLGLDVVSGGELFVARQAGLPADRIHLHGNNKSPAELAMALDEGVGRIVVDNLYELDLLATLAKARGRRVPIWLRLCPGIDVHTHAYRKTGLLDSKFGFTLETGAAEEALIRALDRPLLDVVGLHAHIGSQILDPEPFCETVARLLDFAAAMRAAHRWMLRELSPGGGWGVPYSPADPAAPPEDTVRRLCEAVVTECSRLGLALPRLTVEPGRSIIAPAGVALYGVGARKEIPGMRTYVAVDGGMADNIRPALYGAVYTAVVANKADQPAGERVTIAGRYCESADILIRDIELPHLEAGDVLAVPMVGAYCLSLASNYNLALRPAVVLLHQGRAHRIQRRETYQDLIARDLGLPEDGAGVTRGTLEPPDRAGKRIDH
jgi:diaminopimelate decarboxylase